MSTEPGLHTRLGAPAHHHPHQKGQLGAREGRSARAEVKPTRVPPSFLR